MKELGIWKLFGVVAAVLLLIYWRGRNAVWGGLTIGAILGLVVALFSVLRGNGFDWFIIGKGAISGTIAGFIAELLGKASNLIKRKT